MLALQLVYPRIAKEKFIISEVGIPFTLSDDGYFKLVLTCYADVEGGRAFELLVVYDKYDEVPLHKLVHIDGEAIVGHLYGQEDFFNYLKNHIPIDKYVIGRRDSVFIIYEIANLMTICEDLRNLKLNALNVPLTRGIIGWINYITRNPAVDVIRVLKEIKVKFMVKD